MKTKRVQGEDRGRILLFALSTCGWCKKTKRLLGELGAAYEYIDVDLMEGVEQERVEREMKRWNPRGSFPTLVIDEDTCIVGYDEARIKEVIGR